MFELWAGGVLFFIFWTACTCLVSPINCRMKALFERFFCITYCNSFFRNDFSEPWDRTKNELLKL